MDLFDRLRREDGFSLIELLVVLLVMGFVLGALVMVSTAGQRLGVRVGEAGQAERSAQGGAYAITRELRQATQILPTGTTAGMCPSTATASCIDFLERTKAFNASQDHVLQRVRIDCTQTYTPPRANAYTSQYRSCKRYVSTNVSVPATALQRILVSRVLNWGTSTSWPIFAYRKTDATGTSSTGWITASASTATAGSDAERINVTLQVPSRGESGIVTTSQTLLVQDAAELRNILR